MSEKSDKLRAMLEKRKERRIKLNNRIEILERAHSGGGFRRGQRDGADCKGHAGGSSPPCCGSQLPPPPNPAALSAVGATFEKEVDADED